MLKQSRRGGLYVPAVKRDVRHVDGFCEHAVRLERLDERDHAVGGPGHGAAVGRVVARHVHVRGQAVHDGRVADADRGHHAVRQRRLHGGAATRVRRQYRLLGRPTAVRVRAAQLADRVADHAVRFDVQRAQHVHQTDLTKTRLLLTSDG